MNWPRDPRSSALRATRFGLLSRCQNETLPTWTQINLPFEILKFSDMPGNQSMYYILWLPDLSENFRISHTMYLLVDIFMITVYIYYDSSSIVDSAYRNRFCLSLFLRIVEIFIADTIKKNTLLLHTLITGTRNNLACQSKKKRNWRGSIKQVASWVKYCRTDRYRN